MKKFLITVFALSLTVVSGFAKNIFDHRFFEVKLDVPVQVSNNYFKISDFQKDAELTIDLREIADSLPKSGYKIVIGAQPDFGFNINTGHVSTGVFAGVDIYGNIGIGKGLFDFLGYGNELNKDINFDANAVVDAYLTVKAPVTVDIRRIRCTIQTNAFIPVANINASDINATISNTAEGMFGIKGGGNVAFNTIVDYSMLFDENGAFKLTPEAIMAALTNGMQNSAMGFDVSGSFNYRFSDILMLTTNYNIPFIPGKLLYQTPMEVNFSYETSVQQLMEKVENKPEFGFTKDECKLATLNINRPLKFNAGVEFRPFESDTIVLAGFGGFGVRHPFSKNVGKSTFYPEYSFSARLSMANIIKSSITTAYIDQIYSHQFAIGLNIRLFEIDAGIASQSSKLTSSLQQCGVGAFVNVAIGL